MNTKCLQCSEPATCRGLCHTHYYECKRLVEGNQVSWKLLEDCGKAKPTKDGSLRVRGKSILEYRRAWRADVASKKCACGNPAVAFKNSEFECQRCLDFEAHYYKAGKDSLRKEYRADEWQDETESDLCAA